MTTVGACSPIDLIVKLTAVFSWHEQKNKISMLCADFLSGEYLTIIHRYLPSLFKAQYPPLFTDTEVNNCVSIYQTSE